MSKELVAGMIHNVRQLIAELETVPDKLAKDLLDATYWDPPRPAWNTGELRSSGAAYVGGRFIDMTPWTGSNPGGWYERKGIVGMAGTGGGYFGATGGNIYTELRKKYVGSSLRDTITIIYHSPVAAMMHEWDGGFTADDAGPLYIEAKFLELGGLIAEAFTLVMS